MIDDYIGLSIVLAASVALLTLAKGDTEKWVLLVVGFILAFIVYFVPAKTVVTAFSIPVVRHGLNLNKVDTPILLVAKS